MALAPRDSNSATTGGQIVDMASRQAGRYRLAMRVHVRKPQMSNIIQVMQQMRIVKVGVPAKTVQAGDSPQLPQENAQCPQQPAKLQASSYQGMVAPFPAMPFPFMHPMMFGFPAPFFPPFLCPPPAFAASALSAMQKQAAAARPDDGVGAFHTSSHSAFRPPQAVLNYCGFEPTAIWIADEAFWPAAFCCSRRGLTAASGSCPKASDMYLSRAPLPEGCTYRCARTLGARRFLHSCAEQQVLLIAVVTASGQCTGEGREIYSHGAAPCHSAAT
ncbi:hypothetical protein VOLCADRAFT_97083 [Volvox carteri f. nagariensis]|uniref:Uncharacterized protein n=1 Tax=Volvox carteri f. nagariensis TaxID=3068 RepID=D8UBU9_VOLCA|nr:uncharacterized protein VOLCADRAFT_97083 [Volvox carteri f. nagariensis]EFJ42831.1 hypothetical protein VOLCADRAFT_97083 [Volvox carteri f. nagariensis]|eukprot:XP_002956091.1 hypothetical protein VOLCADRAFT_97083 [Volvox carteri f. nagariensis]